jgi:hypothetical protein
MGAVFSTSREASEQQNGDERAPADQASSADSSRKRKANIPLETTRAHAGSSTSNPKRKPRNHKTTESTKKQKAHQPHMSQTQCVAKADNQNLTKESDKYLGDPTHPLVSAQRARLLATRQKWFLTLSQEAPRSRYVNSVEALLKLSRVLS